MRRISGMTGKFIPEFAFIAEPITRLTKKNQPFSWEEEHNLAFEKLENSPLESPPLT